MVIAACAELARRVVCGEQLNEEASGMYSWLAKGKEKDRPKLLIVVGYAGYAITMKALIPSVEPILLVKSG